MKQKIFILTVAFSITCSASFSQDSVRTRNDKPGTPSSLRTPDNSPQNNDPLINQQRPAIGTINHSGVESNKVTTPNQSTDANATTNLVNINTNTNNSNGNNTHKSTPTDSVIINGAYYKKPANVTNPIKHD